MPDVAPRGGATPAPASRGPGSRVRAPAALAAYVVAVFVVAALAAPPVYLGVRAAAEHVSVLEALARHPFHRFLHRLLLVAALAGLPLLLRALGLRGAAALGLTAPAGRRAAHRRAPLAAAAVGAATVAVVAALAVAAGARGLHPELTAGRLALRVAVALAVAPLVATLEELLFRGVADGGLRRSVRPAAALAGSSVFYALVHFLRRPPNPDVVRWDSGFVLLGDMLAGFTDLAALLPAFATLCVVGACLGRLYQRTGSLWPGVGLHAGGVFALQVQGAVLAAPAAAHRTLWGTGLLMDGWVALAVVCVVWGLAPLVRRCRAALSRAAEPADLPPAAPA